MRSADLSPLAPRIALLRAVLILALAAVAVRASHLSVNDPQARQRASLQGNTLLRMDARRGEIFDRADRKLAISVEAPSIYASPGEVADPRTTARALSEVLGRDAEALERRIRRGGRFTFLGRWVSPEVAARVAALRLPGIGTVSEPRRVAPFGERAGQILGFVNIDGSGVRGIEQQEDAWLRGRGVRLRAERDARGRRLLLPGADPGVTAGGDVRLTIDLAMQASAEAAVARAVTRHAARAGIVVSLDARSGDVLAVAERPTFDPNEFRETPYVETRARSFLDAYEPGSTLKPFLAAGALEEGAVAPGEWIDCEDGSFRVPGKTIRDSHPHGLLDLAGVLRVSSNIGATKLAYRIGPARHFDVLKGFGFGRRTGSGFPDESAGLLRPWDRWRPVDHANVAFGQGIGATPIQLAAATAALAAGGVWRSPRLVAARRSHDGDWIAEPPGESHRVVSTHSARRVTAMLQAVVGPEGTAPMAALDSVPVAGKTGTSQKLDPETGRYFEDRFVAWFVGAAPADDPRIVVLVAIDDPIQLGHTGGSVAGPVFAEVAAAHLAHFGIFTRPARPPHRIAIGGHVNPRAGHGSLEAEEEG